MNARSPRRPAQLSAEQTDFIVGTDDITHTYELAHTTADAVVPLSSANRIDTDARERIVHLIATEGVDLLAESWVTSPPESLPGILWRGYLLREWIRRFPNDVDARFHAARCYQRTHSQPDLSPQLSSQTPTSAKSPAPRTVQKLWDRVFLGNFQGDFSRVLHNSWMFMNFVSYIQPEWITDDSHPLATIVTRRATALKRTAEEFHYGEELFLKNRLF